MSYPTVEIKRTSRLGKPTGIGQGRMTEGTVVGAFRTFQSIPAGSFGLRSVRTMHLMPGTYFRAGTPVYYLPEAQVDNAGSPNNSVNISCRAIIPGTVAVGPTVSYKTFDTAFAGTPVVVMTPGSPLTGGLDTADLGGTPSAFWIVYSVDSGSFQVGGTPSITAYYEAIGGGSCSMNFLAMGP